MLFPLTFNEVLWATIGAVLSLAGIAVLIIVLYMLRPLFTKFIELRADDRRTITMVKEQKSQGKTIVYMSIDDINNIFQKFGLPEGKIGELLMDVVLDAEEKRKKNKEEET